MSTLLSHSSQNHRAIPAALLALLLATGACGDDDTQPPPDAPTTADAAPTTPDASDTADSGTADAGGEGFSLSGAVTGTDLPANAKVVVIWTVSATSSDYSYKYGEGSSAAAQYMVTVPGEAPPAQALNTYEGPEGQIQLGVGVLAVVPADATIPDGMVGDDVMEPLGISTKHAIIWRSGDFSEEDGRTWVGDFSDKTFRCGECVDGADFDSFAPVDCSEVEIVIDDPANLELCNWT